MSKSAKYSLLAATALLVAGVVLYVLYGFDNCERAFYKSGGVVYFAQYFIFSAGIISLAFSVLATWHLWSTPIKIKTAIFTLLILFPLLFASALLSCAGLVFFGVA